MLSAVRRFYARSLGLRRTEKLASSPLWVECGESLLCPVLWLNSSGMGQVVGVVF